MNRPTAQEQQVFQAITRQFPQFCEFLNQWRQDQLELLASTTPDKSDLIRGRVHVLSDLQELLKVRG